MEQQEAIDYTKTDPYRESFEKEFHIGFTKEDEVASVDTSIRSIIDRLLNHTDFDPGKITVHYEESGDFVNIPFEEFEGEGSIVYIQGSIPIESLKVNANPRSTRSFANIISTQEEVTFNESE